jgi:hypothetical protein
LQIGGIFRLDLLLEERFENDCPGLIVGQLFNFGHAIGKPATADNNRIFQRQSQIFGGKIIHIVSLCSPWKESA